MDKDLNVTAKTIKLLEENIGGKLLDVSLSHFFLDLSPQARTKAKINKGDYIKLKSFCKWMKSSTTTKKATH